MHHFKTLATAALVGSMISAPALAQDVAPRWSVEEAEMATGFEALRIGAPSKNLASETALKTLLSNLPELIHVNYGGFAVEDDGSVATNVELTLGEGMPMGLRIGELRVFGLADDQLSALEAGETAALGSRISLKNVELYGLETLAEQASEAYMDQVENMIEDLAEEDIPEEAEVDFKFNSYNFSIGEILIDGFVWHASPEEVDAGIASLFGAEGPPEGQEAWAVFAPLARFYRSMEASSVVYFDAKIAADTETLTDGVEQTMVMDVTIPMMGVSGIDRGDIGSLLYKDMTMAMDMSIVDDESGVVVPIQMGGKVDMVHWQDVKLSKLFGYLEKQEVPSTDVKDLMSLGKATAYGETISMGGKPFYSVGKGSFDMSSWEWFIPEVLSVTAEDYSINVGDYLTFIKDMAMSMPEVADDPDAAEGMEMFDSIATLLEDNGLSTVNMDFAFDYSWDGETGKTGLALSHDLDGFGAMNLAFALGAVTFDDAVVALTPDADAGMGEFDPGDAFGELLVQNASLEGFELMLDDNGGLDKLFNLVVGFAKLAPEDNKDLAMIRGSSPAELRNMVSGLTRMTGFQAASVFPPAVDYINGVADWLAQGGMLSLKIAPEEPLTAGAMETLMPMLETPDEAVEYLGLEFEYVAPEGAEETED